MDFDCKFPKPECDPNGRNDYSTPNFCPPPSPPPIPCMPPVPSVLEGQSLYQAMNNLTKRVNVCIETYNQVMANCYQTLHNLEHQAEENGAYYGNCDVWVEDGYNPDEGSKFKIIHKKVVDRCGQPIRMNLAPAYGNTTNSKITQSIQSASKVNFADKMFIAGPLSENGWYGLTIMNGSPVPSDNTNTELYTMGFTRGGVLRTYPNTTPIDNLIHDEIENAIGVPGILIQNGSLTDDEYRKNIPNAAVQTSRICVGQNYSTREVLILVVGSEGDAQTKGLTSATCAKILQGYGCTIAVECTEGNSVAATDKGVMLVDTGNIQPNGYAFWYITRKCHYKNDYQKELAELFQNYGQCLWDSYINKKGLVDLNNKLQQEIADRIAGDNKLQGNIDAEASARDAADKQLQTNIDAEAAARDAADKQLQANIDAEASARDAADKQLQTNIDAEASARDAADKQLQTNIDAEETDRKAEDVRLQGLIDKINEDITKIENDITTLYAKYNEMQENITDVQNALTALQQTVNSMQSTINEMQQSISNLSQSISNIVNGSTLLPYLSIKGGIMQGNIDMSSMYTINRLIEPTTAQQAATKQYVDNAKNAIQDQITNITNGTTSLPYVKLAGDKMSGPLEIEHDTGTTHIAGKTIEIDDGMNIVTIGQIEGANSATANGIASIGGMTIATSDGVTITDYSGGAQLVHGVAAPVNNTDAANKQYVDEHAGGGGPTYTAGTGIKIESDVISADTNVLATKDELGNYAPSSALSNYLPLSGGTMTGVITGLPAPTNVSDATNKQYVDSNLELVNNKVTSNTSEITNIKNGTTPLPYVLKSGDTMSGALTNTQNIFVGESTSTRTEINTNAINITNSDKNIQITTEGAGTSTLIRSHNGDTSIPLTVQATRTEFQGNIASMGGTLASQVGNTGLFIAGDTQGGKINTRNDGTTAGTIVYNASTNTFNGDINANNNKIYNLNTYQFNLRSDHPSAKFNKSEALSIETLSQSLGNPAVSIVDIQGISGHISYTPFYCLFETGDTLQSGGIYTDILIAANIPVFYRNIFENTDKQIILYGATYPSSSFVQFQIEYSDDDYKIAIKALGTPGGQIIIPAFWTTKTFYDINQA